MRLVGWSLLVLSVLITVVINLLLGFGLFGLGVLVLAVPWLGRRAER